MIDRFALPFLIVAITCACSADNDRAKEPIAAVDRIMLTQLEGPAVELELLPPKPSELAGVAQVIHASGFQCDRVFRANELADRGGALGIYKADCASGQSYRITFVDTQHLVEPWTNKLFGSSNAIHN